MSYRDHAHEKLDGLKKDLRLIAKWFSKTHGGPDISEEHLLEMEPEMRIMTEAMIERRSFVAKEIRAWAEHLGGMA